MKEEQVKKILDYPDCCIGCEYAYKNEALQIDCACLETPPHNCHLNKPQPDEGRLLTFREWLNEKEGNIPFEDLSSVMQARLKAQYDYDKEERLRKQDAKTASTYEAKIGEIFENLEKEQFAEPQHIPQAGREPVIICLTEADLQTLREVALKGKEG